MGQDSLLTNVQRSWALLLTNLIFFLLGNLGFVSVSGFYWIVTVPPDILQ